MSEKQIFLVFILSLFLFSFGDAQSTRGGSFLRHGRPNHRPRHYHRIPLGLNSHGPESMTFDCEGRGPYVGVSDGRILRWEGSQVGWVHFAVTSPNRTHRCDGINDSPLEQLCGRPLGLRFNTKTCELYVADSSMGLLRVGRNGGVAVPVVTSFERARFRFLNALDIDAEGGIIYFTDTSLYDHRWNYAKIMSDGDQSGRLLSYNMNTGSVKVILRNLSFANGVALSKDKDFILVAETGEGIIRRLWLNGEKAGVSEVFLDLQGGLPDNINRNDNGNFWIPQNPNPPIRVDNHARTLEVLDSTKIEDASDVTEYKGDLWIGSVMQSYVIHVT